MMIISIIDTTYIYIHSFLEYSFTYLMQYLYIYIMLISNYGCLINCCMHAYILDGLMKSSSNHLDE